MLKLPNECVCRWITAHLRFSSQSVCLEVDWEMDGVDERVVVHLEHEVDFRAVLDGPLVGQHVLQRQVAVRVQDIDQLKQKLF